MARTTVEDCLKNCPNHFELTMIATDRARKMTSSGDTGWVEQDNDKPIVIALREISKGLLEEVAVAEGIADPDLSGNPLNEASEAEEQAEEEKKPS